MHIGEAKYFNINFPLWFPSCYFWSNSYYLTQLLQPQQVVINTTLFHWLNEQGRAFQTSHPGSQSQCLQVAESSKLLYELDNLTFSPGSNLLQVEDVAPRLCNTSRHSVSCARSRGVCPSLSHTFASAPASVRMRVASTLFPSAAK